MASEKEDTGDYLASHQSFILQDQEFEPILKTISNNKLRVFIGVLQKLTDDHSELGYLEPYPNKALSLLNRLIAQQLLFE